MSCLPVALETTLSKEPTPVNAMERVLQIPELLELVVQAVHSIDRQTLARLARVSKTFHEPSVELLWTYERVSSHTPKPKLARLLGLLPKHLVGGTEPQGECSDLSPLVEDSHWLRFQHYAGHITSIKIDLSLYTPSLLTLLRNRGDVPFPRLRSLIVCAPRPSYPKSEWMVLAGPALQSLQIDANWGYQGIHRDEYTAFGSFCRQLVIRAPNIRHLKIDCFPNAHILLSDKLTLLFCSALKSLASLRTIHFRSEDPVRTEILSALSTLPLLYDVDLELGHPPMATSPAGNMLFPSLRSLKLCGDIEATAACVQSIAHPSNLTELKLTFQNYDLQPESSAPFSRLFQDARSLTTVHLVLGQSLITWAHLQPLLGCTFMTEFTLSSHWGITDDAVLKDIAAAWSGIKRLEITRNPAVQAPQVTLFGLVPLADSCPKLEELAIRITTRLPEKDDARLLLRRLLDPPGFVGRNALTRLELFGSEINAEGDTEEFLGAARTARTLKALWPSLNGEGVTVWPEDESASCAWSETLAALTA